MLQLCTLLKQIENVSPYLTSNSLIRPLYWLLSVVFCYLPIILYCVFKSRYSPLATQAVPSLTLLMLGLFTYFVFQLRKMKQMLGNMWFHVFRSNLDIVTVNQVGQKVGQKEMGRAIFQVFISHFLTTSYQKSSFLIHWIDVTSSKYKKG